LQIRRRADGACQDQSAQSGREGLDAVDDLVGPDIESLRDVVYT
jgi:hypothetical protein